MKNVISTWGRGDFIMLLVIGQSNGALQKEKKTH
jgi:hypothetical protein